MAFDLSPARRYESIQERIRANVVEVPAPVHTQLDTPCWIWQRALNARGYGRISIYDPSRKKMKKVLVHRLVLAVFKGIPLHEVPVSMHACSVKQCCNPAHLDPGTNQDNVDFYNQVERHRGGNVEIYEREPGSDDE